MARLVLALLALIASTTAAADTIVRYAGTSNAGEWVSLTAGDDVPVWFGDWALGFDARACVGTLYVTASAHDADKGATWRLPWSSNGSDYSSPTFISIAAPATGETLLPTSTYGGPLIDWGIVLSPSGGDYVLQLAAYSPVKARWRAQLVGVCVP